MSDIRLTIEDLQYFAENGDANATRLITEIKRYEVAKEQELNNEIKAKYIGGITRLIAQPNAVTDRDGAIPTEVIGLCNEWIEAVTPDEEHIYE